MPETGLNEFHTRYSRKFLIETARTYIAALAETARQRGVPFINHRLDLRTLNQHSFFLDPLHPSAEGNRMMAADIYQQIKTQLPR